MTSASEANDEAAKVEGKGKDGAKVGFEVRHLTQMPTHLARTALGVRPCVAFLEPRSTSGADRDGGVGTAAALIPRLDAKEVAEVFSAPLHDFLTTHPRFHPKAEDDGDARGSRDRWYEGRWIHWHDTHFRMHSFHVPRTKENQILSKPVRSRSSSPHKAGTWSKDTTERERIVGDGHEVQQTHYTVFGMTARILVDCARVAYGSSPDFEHSEETGDEDLIGRLLDRGSLDEVLELGRRSGARESNESGATITEKRKKVGRL